MDKFSGVCQSILHECKLTFLQIISDHDLFVEMPGRDPSDRYPPLETSSHVYSIWHLQTFALYSKFEIKCYEVTSAASTWTLEMM